jgi:hypothetical protein
LGQLPGTKLTEFPTGSAQRVSQNWRMQRWPLIRRSMSKRTRVLVTIGLAVFVTGIYLYAFGQQTAFGLMLRYKCRGIPLAWETPVALADLSISPTPHSQHFFCGYQFELPWDDVDARKSRNVGSIQVTFFRSKDAFWFSCFPPKDFVNGIAKEMNFDRQQFRSDFGDAADSDYDFNRAMLAATPGAITLLTPDQQVRRESSLLLLKVMATPPTDSGIFLLHTPRFKGFQFGAAGRRPNRITVYLYDEKGGLNLIFFQGRHGSAPSISQAEINRVVQSVRRIGDAEVSR